MIKVWIRYDSPSRDALVVRRFVVRSMADLMLTRNDVLIPEACARKLFPNHNWDQYPMAMWENRVRK